MGEPRDSRKSDRRLGIDRRPVEPGTWSRTARPAAASPRDLRVVALGGGTGLPGVLRGLKAALFPTDPAGARTGDAHRLTAIVTVADNGGSSGRLRREHSVLPPGDVRNCLVALSDGDPLMARLFDFRFDGEGEIAGHSLGNLILAALSRIGSGFADAVEQGGRILGIRGRVFPSSRDEVTLRAEFDDGSSVEGECQIRLARRRIRRVHLEPTDASAIPQALAALAAADLIAIGPGSLYTSLIPILLVKDIADSIARSHARVVLVANLMTEPGETDGYTAVDHLEAIRRHAPQIRIHDVLVNTDPIPQDLIDLYAREGAATVRPTPDLIQAAGSRPVERRLLAHGRKIRHDPNTLAGVLVTLGPFQEVPLMSCRSKTAVDYATTLSHRIATHTARVSIIGQGYVGLPLAVAFAEAGFRVTGFDTDVDRVATLASGRSHIPDVPSDKLQTLLRAERYQPVAEPAILAESDVVVICVPTPLRKSKDPDISYVVAAAKEVAIRFRPGQLVILESTTYPGTTEELLMPLFQANGARIGEDLFLAFSPERIDPGNPTFEVKNIPKVVGGVTPACTRLAAALYREIVPRVHEVSTPKVAELAKLYENVFRNVNIALANEFALMCRHLGVNTREVIDAAATKPFGFMPFYPGPGIGGHCIPVDPLYLSWKMRLNGYEARIISVADEINRAMPAHVLSLVAEALNEAGRALKGARILVLGVAYKRGIGDTRESPAYEIIATLLRKGAQVSYADAHVPTFQVDGTELKAVEATGKELRAADCVLILTDHPEVDYGLVGRRARLIVDTRQSVPEIAGKHPVRL